MRCFSRVGGRARSSEMPLSLVLVVPITKLMRSCHSDSTKPSALIWQVFAFWLGHYTPELLLTFCLLLRVGWNGSNKGYSEQGGAFPGNSLPLAWVTTCVFLYLCL